MRAILILALCAGCIADMRPAIYATDQHVEAIVETARAVHVPVRERMELVSFHATRARGWTEAMLKHKGDPDPAERLTIPRSPEDRREIAEEDLLKKEYEADIETEHDIRDKARGWMGGILGGLGLGGGGGILALFMTYRNKILKTLRRKDRAIQQYDAAIESLPRAKRKEIAKGDALEAEHAGIKNGE